MEPQQPTTVRVKRPVNPWMIIGWIILGTVVLCGGGCGAVLILGASTTTTTAPRAAGSTESAPVTASTPAAPTAQPIGTAQTTKAGSTVTVHGFEDPYTETNQFMQPDAGNRYVVVDAEVCAGSTPETVLLFDWSASTNTNRKYTPAITSVAPQLSEGPKTAGECVRGFVSFEAPADESVTSFSFDDSLKWWTIEP